MIGNFEDIFETLKDFGLCETQAEFSRDWLGKSEGYYAYLKSSDERPCLSAVGMLIGRLQSICPSTNDSRWFEERYRLRTAIVSARTMYDGEWEIRHVPKCYWITAV